MQLESEIANHVAAEMTRVDWEVTHPDPLHLITQARPPV
jgi:hypothetical protein